jgi:putative ABC transport system permease protein
MHVRLLFWSLRHRRWRHVLNALVMATTVAVVMLFVAVTVELVSFTRLSADRELARILVTPKMLTGDSSLPMSLYSTLKQIDGVKQVSRYLITRGEHSSGARYLVAGEEESGLELATDFFPVEPAVIEAFKQEKRLGAVVSEETFAELKLKIGDLIELPTEFGPMQVKVVGVSRKGKIGHRIAVHFDYLQELGKNPDACQYRVYAAPQDFDRVAASIIEKTAQTPTPTRAFSDSQFATSWVRRVSVVPALLGFLGAFLMLTTALTLANNAAISIRERRIETATLRTIGFRKSSIIRVVLAEAVLIGIIGGVVSVIVTILLLRNGVQLTPGTDRLLQKVTLTPFAIGCGLLTSVLIPLAGALPAALSSVRRPLVEALRDTA